MVGEKLGSTVAPVGHTGVTEPADGPRQSGTVHRSEASIK